MRYELFYLLNVKQDTDALCLVRLQFIPQGPSIGMLVLICIFSISFGYAWGPLGWLVPSEIQPLNTRSAGQSITVFTQLVSGATVTQTFLMMLCSLQWGVFLFCEHLPVHLLLHFF